ncbi:hypothetical protein KVV02_004490 [Mortierella alpina]|uniref:Mitochondrial genome maintenance protein MGM101 n=1 Tax=Mortierella alpina TaxID=64518 RepID=A0A9P8A317_MORAP|nr:hypothetical protein KVV02_004490 [Mortierella alpina]
MRAMATKPYVPKTTSAKAASTTSYTSRVTAVGRATPVKAAAAPGGPSYTKSDFSTARSVSAQKSFSASPVAAAASSSPPYPPYSDDSLPGSAPYSKPYSKIGGDNGQGSSKEPFATNDSGLKDAVIGEAGAEDGQDWTRSFSGMAIEPFEKEVAEILMQPLSSDDIEIKPDGLLYLPEIKYRRILNKAFGPGGWGLAPRSDHSISPKTISREYALICRGRFVSTARGEQDYFDPSNLATATEGCKSNALMRCCKDLGIASELWDPSFIRKFKAKHCEEQFVEHAVTKKKKKLWKRKDSPDFDYPYSKSK